LRGFFCLTERFSLADDGTKLIDKITVTDKTLYTAPWSFAMQYKKADYKIMEYVCENNRSPPTKDDK
jgi:hypothetical protein